MKSKREYIIPFIGLKIGFHEFNFEIRDAFFEEREYSIIHKGNVNVKLVLEKKETMMIGEYTIVGLVSTDCDRCNDPVEVAVKGEFRLVYKFDTEPSDDESLISVHPDAYELDVRDNIYELITVSLPTRMVHPKGTCNEEMLEMLSKYTVQQNDEDEEDEDWDEEDDDWDDDGLDDDEDFEDFDDEDNDDGDKPIDPRWSILKDLN